MTSRLVADPVLRDTFFVQGNLVAHRSRRACWKCGGSMAGLSLDRLNHAGSYVFLGTLPMCSSRRVGASELQQTRTVIGIGLVKV